MTAPLADRFARELVEHAKLVPLGDTPHGVEIAHRVKGERTYYFVLNHLGEPYAFTRPDDWKPYFDDQADTVAAYGVNVYVKG